MTLEMWREQRALSMHTKMTHAVVGMMPDLLKVAGNVSMAGPVKELTAMEREPSMPMVPVAKK